MADPVAIFESMLPADRVVASGNLLHDYGHDETLSATIRVPQAVLLPESTEEVAAILEVAHRHRIPLTPRGAGSGLSGAAIPDHDGIVVSFERMGRILDIDPANGVAVVEPGVRLRELDDALAPHSLFYPVRPGEESATIGGTVATNAAGMRAVRYGVTRNHVLGLELVLAGGDVVRTGGKIVKVSSGYDLTQLVIGSEGTLAVVTRVWLKLSQRPATTRTVLAPFADLDEVTTAVPAIIGAGLDPLVLEYIDAVTMAGLVSRGGLELGVPESVREQVSAYLVVQVASDHDARVEEDTLALGQLLHDELGAMDVYVLPGESATRLIAAREHAFYNAKEAGFHDLIDVVVPRATLPDYVRRVGEIAAEHDSLIIGCGHAGDGNVHMSVHQPDAEVREQVMEALLRAGIDLGGAISGEHGIGRHKRHWFLQLTDPVSVGLMQGVKATFDPHGILNPGAILEP